MEKLRREETVYFLQPTSGEEINKINESLTHHTYTKNNELICQIGKRMSYLIRHGCKNERVPMDNQGYVNMKALLDWLNKDLHHHLDTEDITWIVDNNDKVRLSIDHLCGVKSNYGHSLELPEMEMEEYREDINGNKRYIVHVTYHKYLPKILLEGLSQMDRNHVHLCKPIGGTWIRRKKRANIAIYVDVQEARRNGWKFFSAPNDVIMCSGDDSGYIPLNYFKEVKNIQTAAQIEIKSSDVANKIKLDKRLNPLIGTKLYTK